MATQAATAASPFAGYYEGNQTELAAGLELGADGRFQYGLAYGALNEGAEGVWTREGDRILLTSDAVRAPEFRMVEQVDGPPGELVVAIEPPPGLPVQLFDLAILFADGERLDYSFRSGEERVPIQADRPPVSVQLALPIFDLLSSPEAVLAIPDGEGYAMRFVFEPNDLGKVAFLSTPLRIEDGDLLIERYDRLIRFRRVGPEP